MSTMVNAPGVHLLVDFWGCRNLQDLSGIEHVLRHAAAVCSASVLDVKLHAFGEGHGVTGVALLAESHISIHTWPETGFAAIDIFMCGQCNPFLSLPVLREYFNPQKERVVSSKRGDMAHGDEAPKAA